MDGSIEVRKATDIPVVDQCQPGMVMYGPTRGKPRATLSFFCPDVTDATTLKRVQQFIDFGYAVTVYGFRRERYNTAYQPQWPNVPLGLTTDARYGQRLLALLKALPILFAHRKAFARTCHFYARNIDQLVLALFARLVGRSRAPVVYEVLDIPPIMMSRGLGPSLLRWIERLCLRRIGLLVLSSAGFHRNYFAPVQRYSGPWFLLENKLYKAREAAHRSPGPSSVDGDRPWVVGYFGLIRGDATIDLIARLSQRLRGRVVFKFSGVLTTVEKSRFDDVLQRCDNISYSGPYVPHLDLERLYGEVDFTWALDLEHPDHNSRWLMPCRFYEAGYHGIPCLAVHGFEVSGAIEQHRIGWTFNAPLEESLVQFFERLTRAEYDLVRSRLAAAPLSLFVAGEDISRLCDTMAAAEATQAAAFAST